MNTDRKSAAPASPRAKRRAVSAAAGVVLGALVLLLPLSAQADPFEITSFASRTTDEAGSDYTQAGGHAFQNRTAFAFKNGNLKDAAVTLQPGFIGNPTTAARCPISNIKDPILVPGLGPTHCPPGSRIGTAIAQILGTSFQARPLFNLVAERGYPAQFGFRIGNTTTILSVVPLPRTESYGLTIGSFNTPNGIGFVSFDTIFCSYGVQGPPDGGGAVTPEIPPAPPARRRRTPQRSPSSPTPSTAPTSSRP